MDMICEKCNYKGNTRDFKPLTSNIKKLESVQDNEIEVLYTKTDYMCPKCWNLGIGEFNTNGHC